MMYAACLLLIASLLPGQEPTKAGPQDDGTIQADAGPLSVRVDIEPRIVGLAETVRLSAVIVCAERVSVKWPTLDEGGGAFKILSTTAEGPDRIEGKFGVQTARRWIVRLEPMKLGALKLGSLRIEYREGEEAPVTTEVALPTIEVLPGPTSSADPGTLRPIPDVTMTASTTQERSAFRFWAGVAVLAITAVGVALVLLGKPSKSPRVRAMEELDRLDRDGRLEREPCRASIVAMTAVVRRYLDEAHHVAAPKLTTPETLASEQGAPTMSEDQRRLLADFLESADVEKFASVEPTLEDCRDCLRRARLFLAGEPST